MAEFIEKSGLKKSMSGLLSVENVPCNIRQLVLDIIDGEMLANVQPVKRGKWSDQMLFDDGFGGGRVGYICSACKKYVPFKGNFCGECGADMRCN